MVAIDGTRPTAEEKAMLQHPAVVGLTLFARNIASVEAVAELNRELRDIRPDLIIAVDQEGGRVQRVVGDSVMHLPPLMTLLGQDAADCAAVRQRIDDHARVMATDVLQLGFDLSFAPVVDRFNADSAVIGDRAFAEDPIVISGLALRYGSVMNECGMVATLKHFPGHGGVAGDTHTERPVDVRSVDVLLAEDVLPYQQVLPRLQRAAVMCSHVIYQKADSRPAGFSPFWVRQVLREQLAFSGVVMSDDLGMAAAAGASLKARAEQAVDAGCDLLLICQSKDSQDVLSHWPGTAADPSIAAALRAQPVVADVTAARQRLSHWWVDQQKQMKGV
jgi:beta-N-acetylhexosaminidase